MKNSLIGYMEVSDNYELLCSLIDNENNKIKLKVDLSDVCKYVYEEVLKIPNDNRPNNFDDLYLDFKIHFEKFRDYILYDSLKNKNIVALCGGYETGKSGFLSMMLENELYYKNCVNTYFVNDINETIEGINLFGNKFTVSQRNFKKISEGLKRIDNTKSFNEKLYIKSMIKNMCVTTKNLKYNNIAFVDTTGYLNLELDKTSEDILKRKLNLANYIIWFIKIEEKTIPQKDIDFLKSIRGDIPKIIIINRADLSTLKQIKQVMENVKNTLIDNKIEYINIFCSSNKINEINDNELQKYIIKNINMIENQIKIWNKNEFYPTFANEFKLFFIHLIKFYKHQIEIEKRKCEKLKNSYSLLVSENIDTNTIDIIESLVYESENNIERLISIYTKLKIIQHDFFGEIKKITDILNIDIPQKTEEELLRREKDHIKDLFKHKLKVKEIDKEQTVQYIINKRIENQKRFCLNTFSCSQQSEILSLFKNKLIKYRYINTQILKPKSVEYDLMFRSFKGNVIIDNDMYDDKKTKKIMYELENRLEQESKINVK